MLIYVPRAGARRRIRGSKASGSAGAWAPWVRGLGVGCAAGGAEAGGGRTERSPGHGPQRRLVGEPLPGGGSSLRSSSEVLPCVGRDTRPSLAPRSRGGGNKFGCRRRAVGAGRRDSGAFGLPAKGRRQRAGTGFPEPSLCLKSLQSFEKRKPSVTRCRLLFPLHFLLCIPFPVAAGQCWPCSGQDFL